MSEKKKGFWSWLGFGKKDEPTPQEEVKQEEIKEADLGSETQEAETQEAETQEFEVPQIPQESVEEVETTVKPVVESVIESVAEPFIEEVIEEAIEEAEAVEEQAEIQTEVVAEQEIIETAQESQKIEEIAPLVEAAEEVVEKLEEQASEVNSIVYVEDNVEAEENVEAEQIEVEQAETEQAVDFAEKFANDLGVQQVLEAEENQDESEEAEKAEETQNSEESVVTSTSDEYQEKPSTGGFFSRLIQGLIKTKQNIGSGFRSLFRGKKIDDDLFEELEEQLLIADLGMPTTTKIINNLSQHATRKQLSDADALYQLLKEELTAVIKPVSQPLEIDTSKKPYVILMVGVNGVGKTTTIGKLARKFQQEGKSVMLAAGDTFRAAAVEQLQVWGERNGIPVVAQASGADSASVIFDAMQSASAKEIDVLIADTAGRLQNKNNLMDELKKIVRVMKKYDETIKFVTRPIK